MAKKNGSVPVTWRKRAALAGYLFILPNVVGFLAFTSLPVLASLLLSFSKWDLLSPPRWVWFKNYIALFHDTDFWRVPNGFFYNTVFMMMAIPVSIMLSLFLAVILNQKLPGMILYRTLFFLPSITAGIGTMILWMWLLNPQFGLINLILSNIYNAFAWLASAVGWHWANWDAIRPLWLSDENWSKPALILMGLWGSMGGMNMILYLAALQGVPQELYEAAKIDGANAWQRFWKITWAMVSPTTFFLFVMGIIGGFQGGFMAAQVMTGGGPNGSTTTISYYIYENAYLWFRMGYASSIAWFLFGVVLILTLFNWKFSQRLVYYG